MASTLPNMSLKTWNLGTDYFSYNELVENWQKVDNHDHSSGKGIQIPEAGIANNAVTANKIANGSIVGTKLAANTITNDRIATDDLQKLGLSDSVVRRGKSIISGTGTRTSTSYGPLTTGAAPGPDQVSSVVLPTDGLIHVLFHATWQNSAAGAGMAAVFLNSTQLKANAGGTAPSVTPAEANINGAVGTGQNVLLYSRSSGLVSASTSGGYTGDVTSGQAVGEVGYGEPISIFASQGTYTVSVQFKAAGSGSVTVSDRKLWVWTTGF